MVVESMAACPVYHRPLNGVAAAPGPAGVSADAPSTWPTGRLSHTSGAQLPPPGPPAGADIAPGGRRGGRGRNFAVAAGAFVVFGPGPCADALEVRLQPLDVQRDDGFTPSVVTVDASTARDFARRRAGGPTGRQPEATTTTTAADADAVSVVSFDGGTTTAVVDHGAVNAFDDGAGGVVYRDRAAGTDRDGTDGPYDADLSAIMTLEAGQTESRALIEPPDGATGVKLWDVGEFDGAAWALYETLDLGADSDYPVFGVGLTLHWLDGDGEDLHLDWSDRNDDPDLPLGGIGTVHGAVIGPDQVAVLWGWGD